MIVGISFANFLFGRKKIVDKFRTYFRRPSQTQSELVPEDKNEFEEVELNTPSLNPLDLKKLRKENEEWNREFAKIRGKLDKASIDLENNFKALKELDIESKDFLRS